MGKNIVAVTGDTFEKVVLKSDKPVLVDFWASWCGPCRMLGPFFEDCANEFDGRAVFAKVNVDEERDLASTYKVMSVPTLILFKDGSAIKKTVGVISKQAMAEIVESVI
jgi:thioredoxin 1